MGGINLYCILFNDSINDTDVSGLLSARTQQLADTACKANEETKKHGVEFCASICEKCDKETGELLEITTTWRRGTSRGCFPPKCPEGFTKSRDLHSHPGVDPSPSPQDMKGPTAPGGDFIATGVPQSADQNIVQIAQYNQHGRFRTLFYNCKDKKFVPKPW
jgi:hypothetical protein